MTNNTIKLCEECDEPISQARLRVAPQSKLCIECAEALEKNGKFQRHKMEHTVRFKGEEVEEMTSHIVRSNG